MKIIAPSMKLLKYVWMTTSVVRHDMIIILGSGNTFNYTEDNRLTN